MAKYINSNRQLPCPFVCIKNSKVNASVARGCGDNNEARQQVGRVALRRARPSGGPLSGGPLIPKRHLVSLCCVSHMVGPLQQLHRVGLLKCIATALQTSLRAVTDVRWEDCERGENTCACWLSCRCRCSSISSLIHCKSWVELIRAG